MTCYFFFFKGTVLDRIDFNVEQACVKTEDGLKQLQKVNTVWLHVNITKTKKELDELYWMFPHPKQKEMNLFGPLMKLAVPAGTCYL